MQLVISGWSDDLIQIEGDIQEEFNVIKDGPLIASLDIGGKLKVYAIYDGCWSFAPGKVDEDIEIPEHWVLEFTDIMPRKYSMGLFVDTRHENVKVTLEEQ